MGLLIKVSGEEKEVFPKVPEEGFDLVEMRELIGCDYIEVVPIGKKFMVVDEDGRIKKKEINQRASEIRKYYGGAGMEAFASVFGDQYMFVVGDVLVLEEGEIQ